MCRTIGETEQTQHFVLMHLLNSAHKQTRKADCNSSKTQSVFSDPATSHAQTRRIDFGPGGRIKNGRYWRLVSCHFGAVVLPLVLFYSLFKFSVTFLRKIAPKDSFEHPASESRSISKLDFHAWNWRRPKDSGMAIVQIRMRNVFLSYNLEKKMKTEDMSCWSDNRLGSSPPGYLKKQSTNRIEKRKRSITGACRSYSSECLSIGNNQVKDEEKLVAVQQ